MTTRFNHTKQQALDFVIDAVEKLDHIRTKRPASLQLIFLWECVLETRGGWAVAAGASKDELAQTIQRVRRKRK